MSLRPLQLKVAVYISIMIWVTGPSLDLDACLVRPACSKGILVETFKSNNWYVSLFQKKKYGRS